MITPFSPEKDIEGSICQGKAQDLLRSENESNGLTAKAMAEESAI